MNSGNEKNEYRHWAEDALDEAGNIGDEQMPYGLDKTDKEEWNYTADGVKRQWLPEGLRDFLNGL